MVAKSESHPLATPTLPPYKAGVALFFEVFWKLKSFASFCAVAIAVCVMAIVVLVVVVVVVVDLVVVLVS